jgi:hypothetical protein
VKLYDHSTPRPAPWAAGVEVGGDTVVLNRTTGALHVLNDTGAAIWSRLDGSRTVSSIVAEVSEVSGVEPDGVQRDVHQFIASLDRLGLVDLAGAGSPPGGADSELLATRGDPHEAAPEVSASARYGIDAIWVDWYTAQVVDALRSRGVEAILLKGPAIRRWLYSDDPEARGYIDADLLVASQSLQTAAEVLSELGFERHDSRDSEPMNLWADTWRRPADGAVVDLHRTLQGCEHSTVDPWPILRATAVQEEVGGTAVLLPGIPARAVQVVLVSPADRPWRRWNDLKLVLDRLPTDAWMEAAALAAALGVERLFGYRLSQSPSGLACARRIGVRTAPRWWLRWEADPVLRWVAWLAALPSWRARLRLARRLVLPPVSYVRSRDPDAGRRGLLAAYAAWAMHGLRLLPGAGSTLLRSVRRGRQA